MRALNCQSLPAAGVSLRTSVVGPDTIEYYIPSSGVPSTTLRETDENGFAGYANLPAGNVEISGLLIERASRSARATTLVKKGTMTILPLPVTP